MFESHVETLEVQMIKNLLVMRESWFRSLGHKDLLEKGMATHCSILLWRIPWTEEPGELQSMDSKELYTIKRLTHSLERLLLPIRTLMLFRGILVLFL